MKERQAGTEAPAAERPEMSPDDAPVHMPIEAAEAWALGWNSAMEYRDRRLDVDPVGEQCCNYGCDVRVSRLRLDRCTSRFGHQLEDGTHLL